MSSNRGEFHWARGSPMKLGAIIIYNILQVKKCTDRLRVELTRLMDDYENTDRMSWCWECTNVYLYSRHNITNDCTKYIVKHYLDQIGHQDAWRVVFVMTDKKRTTNHVNIAVTCPKK